jgi:hypothetical protein
MEKSPSGKTISLCAMPKDIDRFPTLCSEMTRDGSLAGKGVPNASFKGRRVDV